MVTRTLYTDGQIHFTSGNMYFSIFLENRFFAIAQKTERHPKSECRNLQIYWTNSWDSRRFNN